MNVLTGRNPIKNNQKDGMLLQTFNKDYSYTNEWGKNVIETSPYWHSETTFPGIPITYGIGQIRSWSSLDKEESPDCQVTYPINKR